MEHYNNDGLFRGKKGVSMYISNELTYIAIPDLYPNDFMLLTIQLTIPHRKPVLVSFVSHHPKAAQIVMDKLDDLT